MTVANSQSIHRCRICGGERLQQFLTLGAQPHCNRFLRQDELGSEPFYPLDVYFCHDCALVQLGHTVPREVMFLDHPYLSGTTRALTEHFSRLATRIVEQNRLSPQDLVIDVGSNDGTWLNQFRRLGVGTLGVEPAAKIAQLATREGIETVVDFFGSQVAATIRKDKGPATVITAAGVFFHVDDLHDFVSGVRTLLREDGVFIVQAMYLLDIVERCAFDSIYHEHLCYYSLRPLRVLFDSFDMEIFNAERIDIHGGSFVVYVGAKGAHPVTSVVSELLQLEEQHSLYSLRVFEEFADRVTHIKARLGELLAQLKTEGKRISAYGASARGNTLLNSCRIGPDVLEYAAEKNPLKVGLYTPGMHIPVVADEHWHRDPPDYFLVLAWNFLDEFLAKERAYREQGGKFIVPVPEPRVI